MHHLSRRPTDHGPVKTGTGEPDPGYPTALPTTWIPKKLGQVSSQSYSDDQVLGPNVGLESNDNPLTSGESHGDNPELRMRNTTDKDLSQNTIQVDRQDVSHSDGRPPSTPLLPQPPAVEEPGIRQVPLIRVGGVSRQSSNRGTKMQELQTWNGRPVTVPKPGSGDRCIPSGLGSYNRCSQYRRPVVSDRAAKPPGATGGSICSQNICPGQTRRPYSIENGQPNCHMLHQPHGRNKVTEPVSYSLPALAVVHTKRDHAVSRTSAGGEKYHSESRTLQTSAEWMLNTSVFRKVTQIFGLCSVDLFASRLNNQLRRYVSWRPDPFSIATDAFQMSWNQEVGRVCVSPVRPARQVSSQDSPRELHSYTDSSSLEHPALVSGTTRAINRQAGDTAKDRKSPNGPIQSTTSTVGKGSTGTSRMEGLRQLHLTEGVSRRASDLMLAGWSTGTNTTYQSAWNRWAGLCLSRKIDPFSADIQFFLDFLAELFEDGLQISLNQYCSLHDSH